MNRRMSSIFLIAVMIATAFSVSVPKEAISQPVVSVEANGPYGTQQFPYLEGDTVTFTATISGGDVADYKFRWEVTGDGEFDGPGSEPDYWGAFGENQYTHLFLDNNIGEVKIEAWDGVSMKPIYGEGQPLEGTYYNQHLYLYEEYVTIGWEFDISQSITVDELGMFRSYYPYQVYYVDIWDTSTQSKVATTGYMGVYPTIYSWNYWSITPVTIPAGNYIVGMYCRTYYFYGYIPAINQDPSDGIVTAGDIRHQFGSGYPYYNISSNIYPMVSFHYTCGYLVPDIIENTTDIWVDNVSPLVFDVTAIPNPQYEGLPIEFTASFYDPGLNDSWEYRWDFGDGTVTDWINLYEADILFCTSWTHDDSNIASALKLELGDFDITIDIFDWGPLGENEAPSLDLLLEYDVVIAAENYISTASIRDDVGDVLANYSDESGNVVTMWTSDLNDSYYGENGITGRWRDDGYNIFIPGDLRFGDVGLGTIYDSSHPIMRDVTSLSSYYGIRNHGWGIGTIPIADNSLNEPFVGYKDNPIGSGGRIVGLDMFPISGDNSGDYMKLMANAVWWASQKLDPHQQQMPFELPITIHRYKGLNLTNITPSKIFNVKVEVKDDDHEKGAILSTPQLVDFQNFEMGVPVPSSWPAGWYESGAGGWNKTTSGFLPSSYGYRAQHDWHYFGESSLNSPTYDFTYLEGIIVDWDQLVWADRSGGNSDGYVEVSADGGVTWYVIYEWHHPISQTTSHDMGVWGGTAGSSQVQLRFRCYMDNDEVWEVDNINIMTADVYSMKGIGSASTNVTILLNNPPIANAGGPFYSGFEGYPVILDASASIDPEGHVLQYRWDFNNDGTWDTDWLNDPIINYAYPDDYNGLVIVEVTDGCSIVNASADITIYNVPPQVSLSFEPSNPKVIVNFTGSFFDPGSDTHTFTWDFGDGTILTGNLVEQHVYIKTGLYTVTLEVCDDDGGIGNATTTVFVSGPSFLVDAGGNGDFLTIQEAVNAAQPYDLIVVNSGTYKENVVISKALSLWGVGAESTIIDGGGITHGLTIKSGDVSVSGFTIYNSGGFGVKIESGSTNVYNMNISDNERGVGIMNGLGPLNIHDSWIHDNDHEGILIENWTTNSDEVYIQYNRIRNNGHYGIHIENVSNAFHKIMIHDNRDKDTNKVAGTPNGIYGHVKGIFIHNSDNISISYNTIKGYIEFGIFDYGNANDHNLYNKIQFNTIDGLNCSGTVGIVSQFVYTNQIMQNTFQNNGWWGLKSLSPSYIYFCSNWNYWYNNGYNLPINGEFPSNWPDPTQGNTSLGGAFYFDPPPGAEIPAFYFDGNIMINNPIGIMVEGATNKLILSNNTIKESEIAIFVESGDPIIENNRLKNNVEAINIAIGSPVIQGNIIDHNKVGITIDDGANPKIGENVLVHNDVDIITPSPKSLIAYAKDLLEGIKTGNKKIDKRIDSVIDRIQMSLNIDPKHPNKPWKKYPLWVDEKHLDTQHGKKIFDDTKWAVRELKNLIEKENPPQSVKDTCQVAIDKLIMADGLLAHIAYEEAQTYSGDKMVDMELENCKSELVRGPKDLNHKRKDGTPEPKYGQAIDHYKKAWEHAQLAIKFAGK